LPFITGHSLIICRLRLNGQRFGQPVEREHKTTLNLAIIAHLNGLFSSQTWTSLHIGFWIQTGLGCPRPQGLPNHHNPRRIQRSDV